MLKGDGGVAAIGIGAQRRRGIELDIHGGEVQIVPVIVVPKQSRIILHLIRRRHRRGRVDGEAVRARGVGGLRGESVVV